MTQVKTADTDGYEAVQLGFEESRKLNKGERGTSKERGSGPAAPEGDPHPRGGSQGRG